jgi:uncharacterized protein
MELLEQIEGFEWDKGNIDKNWLLHNVHHAEAEQIFFNEPLITARDEKHSSAKEQRHFALGRTDNNRYLFVSFTIRNGLIRIISARDMSRKERTAYHEKN